MTHHTREKARITNQILAHARLHSSNASRKLEVLTYRCYSHAGPDAWKASLVATTNKGLVKLLAEEYHVMGELYAMEELLAKIQFDTGIVLHEVSEGSTVRTDGKLRRRDGMSKMLGGLAVMLGMKRQRVHDGEHLQGHTNVGGREVVHDYVSQARPLVDFGPSRPPPIPYDHRPSQIPRWHHSPARGSPSVFNRPMVPRPSSPALEQPQEDEAAPETPRAPTTEPHTGVSTNSARACVTRGMGQNISVDVHVALQPSDEGIDAIHLHTGRESPHAASEDHQEADPPHPAAPSSATVPQDTHSVNGPVLSPHLELASIAAPSPRLSAQQPATSSHQSLRSNDVLPEQRSVERLVGQMRSVGREQLGASEGRQSLSRAPSVTEYTMSGTEQSHSADRMPSQRREQVDGEMHVEGTRGRYQASVESASFGD